MDSSKEILNAERLDTKSRLSKLVEVGKPILVQTALIQNKDFTEGDVVKVREFFEASKPHVHPRVWPEYWDHIELAGQYARILAEKINAKNFRLNPYELQSLGMLHDVGRLITPHRLYRTNIVGDSLMKRIGVRRDLWDKQNPEAKIYGRQEGISDAKDMIIEQQVLMLADNLGRRVEDGNLIKFEELFNLTDQQVSRYQGEIFASERFGKRSLLQAMTKESQILMETKQLFESNYGINFDEVREEIAKTVPNLIILGK